MKQIKYLSLITAITLFIACEEVIEIDLNSSNPAVVVEGNISIGKTAEVHLSYTHDYFTNDERQNIEDLVVTLTSNNNETEILEHTFNGVYVGKTVIGKANTTYELVIEIDNQVLTGKSVIPSDFEIVSMKLEEATFNRPMQGASDTASYTLNLVFTDDKEQRNFYMLAMTQNGEEGEYSYLMIDDEFYNQTGSISYSPMMFQFMENDTVNLQLYSLDRETYSFYTQLSDVTGGDGMQAIKGTGTPYNPASNMGDDILGYFSAWAIIDSTFIIEAPEL